ncbi:hypothetical protein APHAL10511_008043 [Amanita phalloides]|nr:hypothetical protein APHAL10511_008043 [Amanita phalloides]
MTGKHIRLRRHYQRLLALQYSDSIGPPANMAAMTTLKPDSKEKEGAAISQLEFRPSSSTRATVPVFGDNGSTTLLQGSQQNIPPSAASITLASVMGLRRRRSPKSLYSNPQYQAIQRVLLLNAYPLAYIILWIPGIANRLIEATGHKSTAMQILQASTQLVGLANALTYGWNERVAKQLKERFFKDR